MGHTRTFAKQGGVWGPWSGKRGTGQSGANWRQSRRRRSERSERAGEARSASTSGASGFALGLCLSTPRFVFVDSSVCVGQLPGLCLSTPRFVLVDSPVCVGQLLGLFWSTPRFVLVDTGLVFVDSPGVFSSAAVVWFPTTLLFWWDRSCPTLGPGQHCCFSVVSRVLFGRFSPATPRVFLSWSGFFSRASGARSVF
jgi:hypothetical protein